MTWTQASAIATDERLADVTWGGDRFVAVAGGAVVYSADGDRWTAASDTATESDDRLTRVTSNGTRFVAVGTGFGMIVHSDNGDQWMRATDTGVTYYFNLVAWGGNHFIANAIKREQPLNMVRTECRW